MVERLTMTKVVNWLNQNYLYNGEAFPFVVEPPVVPEAPEHLGIVTPIQGRGFLHERAFEHNGFQLRIRSAQNVPEVARVVAVDIDTILNSLQMPWRPEGSHVIELGWIGGGPVPLSTDRTSYRYSWVCSYYYIAATGF